MNCFRVTLVLIAAAETLLAAVLSGFGHLTDGQEIEENLITSRRRAIAEHDHRTDPAYAGILGNQEDSDDMKHLSPLEIKQRLKSILEIMDHNKNGVIEKNELADKLLESYMKLSAEESDSEFQTSDLDEDGFVTWIEYIGDTYNSQQEYNDANDDVTGEEKDLFDAADSDKDGKLSQTEFRRFYSPEDYAHMQPILVTGAMSRFDINRDGKISFDEFIGNRKFELGSTRLEEEKETFEKNLDINKNGVLEGTELHTWASPSNIVMADSEADILITKTDMNNDGLLSFDEVLDNYAAFISAESEGYFLLRDEL